MRPEPTIGRRLRKAQGRSRWRIISACMQERINVPEQPSSLAASSHRRELRASACCRQRTHQLPSPSPHINALCPANTSIQNGWRHGQTMHEFSSPAACSRSMCTAGPHHRTHQAHPWRTALQP
jgi:hypothetical protein